MPERALLVYASTHGHTAKVAGRLAESLRAHGLDVDLREIANADEAKPKDAAMVIVAASVHRGHHQREVVDWVKGHRHALDERPSAFVSISLQAAEDGDESREAVQHCIDVFVEETGWQPGRSAAVAGALQYREYDVFTRLLMRLLMRHMGHPTDTSHDYDYTDWEAVVRLGEEFAKLATEP